MIKVGQTWRNRNGHMVTVTHEGPQLGRFTVEYVHSPLTRYSVDKDGESFADFDHAHGLSERVTRVYIAGPMTGLPELNFPAFHAAAADYRKRGCFVVNPAELNPDHAMPWFECMQRDIPALCTCEMIVLLDGWTESKGARLEHHVARELGFAICYPS